MLYITHIDVPSRRVTFSVVALCVGTGIASAGEAHFNLTGLIIMFFAETCEATRLVLTQKLLTNLKFPALEGLYYMAPICSFWMSGLATVYPYPYLYPLPLPLPLPLTPTPTPTPYPYPYP